MGRAFFFFAQILHQLIRQLLDGNHASLTYVGIPLTLDSQAFEATNKTDYEARLIAMLLIELVTLWRQMFKT